VKACIFAWKKNKSKHYSIASKKSYSIIELAKMFKSKIRYLPKREGERFASALTKMNLNNKIIRLEAKIKLRNYIKNFLMNNH
jgi:UDP-glucose 4-epimerase